MEIVESLKPLVPWPLKVAVKVVLSRLPLKNSFWKRVGIFVHGRMDKPEYAYEIFCKHFVRYSSMRPDGKAVSLELGPGDSLFSAIIAHALGCAGTFLLDVGNYALKDLSIYREMETFLQKKGFPIPKPDESPGLEGLLKVYSAKYLVEGLRSLRGIPNASVDFIWSQHVLEHVRKAEFFDLMVELRRVLRPGGMCSHAVDLKDHMGFALNNLRFPESLWESDFVARSGFYTNRIRFPEMLHLFERAGFRPAVVSVNRWDRLPTPKGKLAKEFQSVSEADLRVSEFEVVLRPA